MSHHNTQIAQLDVQSRRGQKRRANRMSQAGMHPGMFPGMMMNPMMAMMGNPMVGPMNFGVDDSLSEDVPLANVASSAAKAGPPQGPTRSNLPDAAAAGQAPSADPAEQAAKQAMFELQQARASLYQADQSALRSREDQAINRGHSTIRAIPKAGQNRFCSSKKP